MQNATQTQLKFKINSVEKHRGRQKSMMNRTELDSANSSFSAEIQTPQTSKMDSTQNFGLESELCGHFMMCVSKGSREYIRLGQ